MRQLVHVFRILGVENRVGTMQVTIQLNDVLDNVLYVVNEENLIFESVWF